MMLFQKVTGYSTKNPLPFHIVKKKGWRKNYIPHEVQSFIIETYCGEEIKMHKLRRDKLIFVDREERKRYNKKICGLCKSRILKEIHGKT